MRKSAKFKLFPSKCVWAEDERLWVLNFDRLSLGSFEVKWQKHPFLWCFTKV